MFVLLGCLIGVVQALVYVNVLSYPCCCSLFVETEIKREHLLALCSCITSSMQGLPSVIMLTDDIVPGPSLLAVVR